MTLTPPAVIRVDLDASPRSAVQPRRRVGTPASSSWWTERARSGGVTAGFSKGEMLKPESPGGTDGLLDRVHTLLDELSGPALNG